MALRAITAFSVAQRFDCDSQRTCSREIHRWRPQSAADNRRPASFKLSAATSVYLLPEAPSRAQPTGVNDSLNGSAHKPTGAAVPAATFAGWFFSSGRLARPTASVGSIIVASLRLPLYARRESKSISLFVCPYQFRRQQYCPPRLQSLLVNVNSYDRASKVCAYCVCVLLCIHFIYNIVVCRPIRALWISVGSIQFSPVEFSCDPNASSKSIVHCLSCRCQRSILLFGHCHHYSFI